MEPVTGRGQLDRDAECEEVPHRPFHPFYNKPTLLIYRDSNKVALIHISSRHIFDFIRRRAASDSAQRLWTRAALRPVGIRQ